MGRTGRKWNGSVYFLFTDRENAKYNKSKYNYYNNMW